MWEGEDDTDGDKEMASEGVEEEDGDEQESPPPRRPTRGSRAPKTISLYANNSDKGQMANRAPGASKPLTTILEAIQSKYPSYM